MSCPKEAHLCKFTLGTWPLLYDPAAKTMERDAGQPMRAAQSKGVGGDSLTGRRGALPIIYRPKYPTLILEVVSRGGSKLAFVWVSGHVRLAGNSPAEAAAKAPRNLRAANSPVL
jgi:hypothetical protein